MSIVILSIDGDESTSEVMDWLSYSGATGIRVNTMDARSYIHLNNSNKDVCIQEPLTISDCSLWIRKIGGVPYMELPRDEHGMLNYYVNAQARTEYRDVRQGFINSFRKESTLGSAEGDVNKINALELATTCGLFIPETKLSSGECSITFSREIIESCFSCGYISKEGFEVNIPLFTEAQKFNTCLNRKISIDENGDIKNCPVLQKSYGNIKTVSLQSAIAQKEFKELWEVNKDQIDVCKDCEFRYICTDCRAFISDDRNRFSKPSKCSYDPYSARWN